MRSRRNEVLLVVNPAADLFPKPKTPNPKPQAQTLYPKPCQPKVGVEALRARLYWLKGDGEEPLCRSPLLVFRVLTPGFAFRVQDFKLTK